MDMVPLYYLISSLAFTTVISIVIFFFYSRSHPQRLSKTPCPESYPLIGNLIAFLRNRHRFHDWVTEMLSQTPSNTLQVRGFLDTHRGKEMAYVQMKSIAAAVIYGFEIDEMFGGRRRTVRPNYTLSLVLKMEGGLLVRLKKRGQTQTETKTENVDPRVNI
ncbi:hypothetical protein NE237_002813 [Protea cynaroides]|uniref:Cytochrome P450 n=1 Tax=Protea cynaroides TaxID=273540 RepID=A0A9Q0KG85_9MAGN|nr:hypothetical protein NE237_002813 [Protea cynaroides]